MFWNYVILHGNKSNKKEDQVTKLFLGSVNQTMNMKQTSLVQELVSEIWYPKVCFGVFKVLV